MCEKHFVLISESVSLNTAVQLQNSLSSGNASLGKSNVSPILSPLCFFFCLNSVYFHLMIWESPWFVMSGRRVFYALCSARVQSIQSTRLWTSVWFVEDMVYSLEYFLPLDLLWKLFGRLSKFEGEEPSCFFTSMSSCAGPGNVFCWIFFYHFVAWIRYLRVGFGDSQFKFG